MFQEGGAPIYLDHNATTPVDPHVLDAMLPYAREQFGNPSSGYALGRVAKQGLGKARGEVASLIGCSGEEIVFTSGGSESNNAVLKGVVDLREPSKAHIITSEVEHPAILNPALYLLELGVRVTTLPVDRDGLVDPDGVKKAITRNTVLISIMLANNETGTLQPVREIAMAARGSGIPVHTDAAQAIGKMRVDVDALGVDFLTIAGHKVYAPKGVGALYMRKGRTLTPLIHGASQERGLRAGTENVMLAVGLGEACRVARERLEEDMVAAQKCRDRLENLLFEGIDDLVLNGHPVKRLPNTLNVSIPGLPGDQILEGVPAIMASTGAACHDRSVRLSHVLAAMGVPPQIGMGALRFTTGRSNRAEQMDEVAQRLVSQVRRMRP